MKLALACLFGLVAVALAVPNIPTSSRGCRYILGKCVEECPEGTHAYATNCQTPRTPEPTCDEPNPIQEEHGLCDFSDCYCDAPTVRDTKTNTCVMLEHCPGK